MDTLKRLSLARIVLALLLVVTKWQEAQEGCQPLVTPGGAPVGCSARCLVRDPAFGCSPTKLMAALAAERQSWWPSYASTTTPASREWYKYGGRVEMVEAFPYPALVRNVHDAMLFWLAVDGVLVAAQRASPRRASREPSQVSLGANAVPLSAYAAVAGYVQDRLRNSLSRYLAEALSWAWIFILFAMAQLDWRLIFGSAKPERRVSMRLQEPDQPKQSRLGRVRSAVVSAVI